jgi:DNA polymerase V
MYAIVDCNSFYCSCERVFQPQLHGQPVVVLSNNDGCIIARSDEAKKLGVGMAGPYFKAKPLIEKEGVTVFSSNYNLYGDMSRRVMETLRHLAGKENVEVYSVDEAFINLQQVPAQELKAFAHQLRETVEMWTGVAVSVGVAPTKVLSKVANNLAKKHKPETNCVLVLDTERRINQALEKTSVKDVWGIGRQYAYKFFNMNLLTAADLKKMPEAWMRTHMGGVVGQRMWQELNGFPTLQLEEQTEAKKMIATTRMFGDPVKDLQPIKEAIATYTARAVEKLRRQQSAAGAINVFIVPKETTESADGRFHHGPSISAFTLLPRATCLTNELIKPAIHLVEQIFEPNRLYKKAGVILSHLVKDNSIQGNLFAPAEQQKYRQLMSAMDNINFSMRNDVLKFAASGTTRDWKMRQELRTPRYTSRWDELREVK